MQKTLVILVVGLTPALIGDHTPHLSRLVGRGGMRPLKTVFPAVTCSVQSSLLTGVSPAEHGAVANGWYFRDQADVRLWSQSNHLIQAENVWDAGKRRDPTFTCAQMFWWYNMYSSADWSATPRPQYRANGRKIPDHYTHPPELHDELDQRFGSFPLFKFWGPVTGIESSEWITRATLHVMQTRSPTLTLCYLPHLDYNLQRLGPDAANPTVAQDLLEIDALCGELIDAASRDGTNVIVVSEYGITPVTDAIHINRTLREAGLLAVRRENGLEAFDAGASQAFAMTDHQVAHIYVKSPTPVDQVRKLIEGLDGVEAVWGEEEKRGGGLDHPRSGELVAISRPDRWFSYYYWLDDKQAPDFARTVDIHRKPGYDPVELFIDPEIRWPKLAIGWRLAKRAMGSRALLDVISCRDTALVRGSHGRLTDETDHGPLVISSRPDLLSDDPVDALDFKELMLNHVF